MKSKLWERLGATSPVFFVESALHGTWADSDIMSMTIRRGTSMAGVSTSTAEVHIRWEITSAASSDQGMRIGINSYGRSRLAALTGMDPALFAYRFTGRIAGQTVTDPGGDRQRTTKIDCHDWLALVTQLDAGALVVRDFPNLWSLYRNMFFRANISGLILLEAFGSKWHWVRWPPEEDGLNSKLISTSDVIGKYTTDVGNLIRMTRGGQPQGIAHDHLVTMAEDWRTFGEHPLQRSQVIAPIEWTQPTTIPLRMSWDQWTAPGSTTLQTWEITVGDEQYVTKGEHLDMTHIWVIGGETGLHGAMIARASAAAADRYRVERVNVDILHLLRPDSEGGTPADRAQAGQLITKEHGDPITLGYDWPPHVAGVYFVRSLSENITPDSWRMELDLIPANQVTGEPVPSDLAGRTWDTAYPQLTTWQEPTTTWEASP